MGTYGIVANVLSDRVLRTGAKIFICYCNGDAAHPRVVGRGKCGRVVRKYTSYKRLTNFRAAWIPEHLRDRVEWIYAKNKAEEIAKTLNDMWSDVRFFSRHGERLIKDGKSEGEAFKRALVMVDGSPAPTPEAPIAEA